MSELLAGVRVIESAMLFNGDTVGAHLGDLGADVIKVERPQGGDYLRHFLGQITPGHSPAHVQINRNKRSVAIDLRTSAGEDVFWRLLATADVFVDGNAADACAKLGIGFEDQRQHKPDIVYCQYSGYGAAGPYAPVPTHGQMMDALAGAFPMEMGNDGFLHPGRHAGPMSGMNSGGEGTAAGAIHAAFHVASALVRRDRTGEGCFIDVSGTEGVIAQAWISATYTLNERRIADRRSMPAVDQGRMSGAKYQYYQCRDGKNVLFCCIEPKFWRNFCHAVGRDDLLETHGGNADGASGAGIDFGRGEEDLRHELQKVFSTRTLAEWMTLAAEHDIAMGPAYRSVLEAEDPHLQFRETFHEAVHPRAGPYTFVREAGQVAGQRYRIRWHAPLLGEHTREVLGEIGLSDDEIAALVDEQVVAVADNERSQYG